MKKSSPFYFALAVLFAGACASNNKVPTVMAPPTVTVPATEAAPVETKPAATNAVAEATPARERRGTNDPIAKIRDEGLNRSQVMETVRYLSDVIGPRLTGSPGMKRANEWTKTKLESWGMTNAQVEPWGAFGRGWSLQKFSIDVTEPQYFPVKAYPNAWSPGFSKPLKAEVVWVEGTTTNQLEKYKGQLKGKIVLLGAPRTAPARFEPLSRRYEASNLLAMANAEVPRGSGFDAQRTRQLASEPNDPNQFGDRTSAVTNSVRSTNAPSGRRGGNNNRPLAFVAKEGAALVLTPSFTGDAGTIFVSGVSVPQPESTNTASQGVGISTRVQGYSTNAPSYPAQATLAIEDYNRLVRMAKLGEKLKMEVDLRTQFHNDDLMAYNTVAEIPGTDLKDEIVMIGAHLDSWHSGTGATDNGTGCAAAMEALRIIKATGLKPRRTIRVALWSGEEQGLLGSRAYVSKHFGKYVTNTIQVASAGDPNDTNSRTNRTTRRELQKEKDYEKLSVYFNLDNGAGKIRGVYMQGNEAVRPYFRKWLEPFRDLGAETLTPNNTGGTDHLSFHNVGLPGFQFIQDPLDYASRTHHSNEDVYDRIQPDDLKQAATIMAAFVYNAAMLDEKLPRRQVEP